MYDIEQITVAKSLSEALALYAADPNLTVVAGGTDVLIQIREGKRAGCRLLSIHELPALSGVTLEADGTLVLGPCTTFAQISCHPLVRERLPMLAQAVDQAGGPQLRAVGTIGGNLCNGVTSADSVPMLLCLNASLVLSGPGGERRVAVENFYRGPGRVDLAPAELLTAIRISPQDYEQFGGQYIKYAQRKAMDIATIGVAATVRLDAEKRTVETLRLAFGVAAPTPIRASAAEDAACGQPLTPQLLDRVAHAAVAAVHPRTSWRASKEFRLRLVDELSRRAVLQAVIGAGGAIHA